MSELKAVHAFDVYEAYTKTGDDDAAQVYLKSEVDKVIAEKDKEIARLDDLAHAHNIELLRKENLIAELKNLKQALMADDLRYRYRIRHQKHKRCLAMARICYMKSWSCLQYFTPREKYDHWKKWQKRWTELANKFKEAK